MDYKIYTSLESLPNTCQTFTKTKLAELFQESFTLCIFCWLFSVVSVELLNSLLLRRDFLWNTINMFTLWFIQSWLVRPWLNYLYPLRCMQYAWLYFDVLELGLLTTRCLPVVREDLGLRNIAHLSWCKQSSQGLANQD